MEKTTVRFPIRLKLLLLLLGVSVLTISLFAFLGTYSGRKAILEATSRHMASVRSGRAAHLRSYLRSKVGEVQALSRSPAIHEAFREFKLAFGEISGQRNASLNSVGNKFDKAVHPNSRKTQQSLGSGKGVPVEFKAVQWTRLRPAGFAWRSHVKRHLGQSSARRSPTGVDGLEQHSVVCLHSLQHPISRAWICWRNGGSEKTIPRSQCRQINSYR